MSEMKLDRVSHLLHVEPVFRGPEKWVNLRELQEFIRGERYAFRAMSPDGARLTEERPTGHVGQP